MKSSILGIQFRQNKNSIQQEQTSIRRELGKATKIDFISALDESIDWTNPAVIMAGYQGVVLGGSGEFHFDGNCTVTDPARVTSQLILKRLEPLLSYLFTHDVPTLGICYGHQLLGKFAGAEVKCDPKQQKICSHQVKLLSKQNNVLFGDLPTCFLAHYGHKDSLDRVPDGAKLLMAGGNKCKVSALQYKNNIFSTQFHPELNFADMVERIKLSPGYLPDGAVPEDYFQDDPASNTILQNFGRFVAQQNKKYV